MSVQKEQSNSKPVSYSVRMAVKTPSRFVQYRMIEADVTVTGEDAEDCRDRALKALAVSLADTCWLMQEPPPDEIRPVLEEVLGEEETASRYAEEQ